MNGLSVIIPVKPPEPYLPQLVRKIHCALTHLPHEVLIQTEIGLTNAVVKGVEKSRYDTIVVMDADGSHDPISLAIMYATLNGFEGFDLLIGSKVHGYTDDSLFRRFISWFYRKLAKSTLKLDVEDNMSGFVIGHRNVFLTLKPSTDYKFLLHLLTSNRSLKIYEIPIYFKKRQSGRSKTTLRTGLKTFSTIMRLWRNQS